MDDFRVEVYKTLEITDLLELQGLNVDHDRAKVIEENRIDQHFPLVTRNRPDLSYVVILPKPPPSRSSAPSEFHYIAPESEAEPPHPQDQANEDSPSPALT